MSGHQTATIEDTVFFWFAANDTSGSGGDGATPLFDVREAGAAASAAPLLSGTPALLSNAAYPAGCHEIAVAATAANGFAVDDTFGVFCTLAVDSQNPSGFVGSCTLTPVLAQINVALDTAILELGVAAPTATPSLRTGLMLLYMAFLNQRDTIAAEDEIHNSAGTVIAKATLSDDAVLFRKTKYT